MHKPIPWLRICAATLLLFAHRPVTVAQETNALANLAPTNRLERLRSLSLEDLLHKEISSVSKRPEDWFKAPAALFVITDEDIRRSGARTIADALRMAPGMNVAQVDANTWAISARGFADIFSDKLLVLMDGRSLYSTYSAGVYWNTVDYLLEDIDHIEVIRGPGGTLWGANAVNGVINIITKDARDTEGIYITGGGGTEERGFAGVRYGAKVTDDTFARGYVKYNNRDSSPGGVDDSDALQGGVRLDWHRDQSRLTLQGDYYSEEHGNKITYPTFSPPFSQTVSDRFRFSGGNAMLRFTREFSQESELQFQTYYDHVLQVENDRQRVQDTYDVDVQQRFSLPLRQSVMVGVGYRYLPDFIEDTPGALFRPRSRYQHLFSSFLQDEITLIEDRLKLTIGSKFEHNDFTGWEFQPSARLAWFPTEKQTVWAAVSRAVQIPSRGATDYRPTVPQLLPPPNSYIPVGGGVSFPAMVYSTGSRDLEPQELIAYELGYRVQPHPRLSFDVATFYHDYQNLFVGTFQGPSFQTNPFPYFLFTGGAVNGGTAEAYGVEVASEWRVMDSWRLSAAYTYLELQIPDAQALFQEGRDPHHQATLRSSVDLPWNLSFDLQGRYVDALPGFGVDCYYDLDARLAWRMTKNLELSVVGQNLLEPRRVEFGRQTFSPYKELNPVSRGFYVQLTGRF